MILKIVSTLLVIVLAFSSRVGATGPYSESVDEWFWTAAHIVVGVVIMISIWAPR